MFSGIWFGRRWFGRRWYAGGPVPAPALWLSPDWWNQRWWAQRRMPQSLLGALEYFFQNTPELTAQFPGGLWTGVARPQAQPWIVMQDVTEGNPGETLEDRQEDITFKVVGAGLENTRTAGVILKTLLMAESRPPFVWADGQETAPWLFDSKPIPIPGFMPNLGGKLYSYTIMIRFQVRPNPVMPV